MKAHAHRSLARVKPVDVSNWFQQAWPRAKKHPSLITCDSIAKRINVAVDFENKNAREAAISKDFEEIEAPYVAALKHARSFLKCSPAVLADLAKTLAAIPEFPDEFPFVHTNQAATRIKRTISAIFEAERTLKNVLTLCTPPTIPKHKDRMQWIADAAINGWQLTIDKKSFAKGEDSPLTIFTELALKNIGFYYSRKTISDHLRNRQSRPRRGVSRSK